MEKDKKKQLREQYANRHPDMGIVGWQYGKRLWIAVTKDARADKNRSEFQLKLGTWPNKELQTLYTAHPEEFTWSYLCPLRYEDPTEDYTEDLELLLMDFMEKHPEAEPMKTGKKLR